MENLSIQQVSKRSTTLFYETPGYVYFLSAEDDCQTCASIKIGVTIQGGLLRRLRSIQSSNFKKIRLLGVLEMKNMREAEMAEKQWHLDFKNTEATPYGTAGYEWFKATSELKNRISKETVPPGHIEGCPDKDKILRIFA